MEQVHRLLPVRPWPAITTHNRGNHSVRSERWRYIRYADGTEELYDHRNDPHEWKNLASDPRLAEVKRKYDPTGLFFVHHGVGSEDWSADGFARVVK